MTDLKRFDLRTSDVDGYEEDDEDDADANDVQDALQTNYESTQSVEDWGYSTRGSEDCTVYF